MKKLYELLTQDDLEQLKWITKTANDFLKYQYNKLTITDLFNHYGVSFERYNPKELQFSK